jgi:hemin uptake protein HemP
MMTLPDDSQSKSDSDPPPPTPPKRGGGVDPPRVLRSEDLLQGAREVWIEHGKEMYRLRVTAGGKLYLTK